MVETDIYHERLQEISRLPIEKRSKARLRLIEELEDD